MSRLGSQIKHLYNALCWAYFRWEVRSGWRRI